jgi:ribosomal protein L32
VSVHARRRPVRASASPSVHSFTGTTLRKQSKTMPYCSKCGEVTSAAAACKACGFAGEIGGGIAPVSMGETAQNTKSDEYVPDGLADALLGFKPKEPPPPSALAPAFRRGESICGACMKPISGEAVALDDGRLLHCTCFMCSRCSVRIASEGGKYEYCASGRRIYCSSCAPDGTKQEATDVQDIGQLLGDAEWYYSDGDSSEGPIGLSRMKKLCAQPTPPDASRPLAPTNPLPPHTPRLATSHACTRARARPCPGPPPPRRASPHLPPPPLAPPPPTRRRRRCSQSQMARSPPRATAGGRTCLRGRTG